MSFEGGFKIDVDLMRGLPEQKSAWPIWLGDPILFESMVFRASPELGQAVTATSAQNEQ